MSPLISTVNIIMANTPPKGTEFAIPNFNIATIVQMTGSGVEPASQQVVMTGLPKSYMNGTYTSTASHCFSGDSVAYGAYHCFKRNGLPLLGADNIYYYGPCWESRSASNRYNEDGTYGGTTTTVVDGNDVLGEYVSITAPYAFALNAYSLVSSNYNGVSSPCSGWVIAGSNDGQTYTMVDTVTDTPLPVDGYQLFNINNTSEYSTYIIIITSITYGFGAANIGTWNLYSIPQSGSSITNIAVNVPLSAATGLFTGTSSEITGVSFVGAADYVDSAVMNSSLSLIYGTAEEPSSLYSLVKDTVQKGGTIVSVELTDIDPLSSVFDTLGTGRAPLLNDFREHLVKHNAWTSDGNGGYRNEPGINDSLTFYAEYSVNVTSTCIREGEEPLVTTQTITQIYQIVLSVVEDAPLNDETPV